MPRRSKVLSLPEAVRQTLDRKLVEHGFQDYEDLSEWLHGKGYEISKSAVHRYGQEFEARLAALRLASAQAKEIVTAIGDNEGAMGDALTSLAQEKAFQVLMNLEAEDEEISLDKLMTSIARLNRTGIQQKKFQQEMREKARAAAEEVEEITRQEGLSDDVAATIREKILGIPN